jgi:hypothetical protein
VINDVKTNTTSYKQILKQILFSTLKEMIGSNKFKYEYAIQQKEPTIDELTQSCNKLIENIESSHQLNLIQYETTINALNSKIGELDVEFNLFC